MVNLDEMSDYDLNDFYLKSLGSPAWLAQQVFPDRPKGYIRAVAALADYAHRKSYAMKLRRDGKISEAEEQERHCARIHADLPAYAQWQTHGPLDVAPNIGLDNDLA